MSKRTILTETDFGRSDGAVTWMAVNAGTVPSLNAVAIDPIIPATVYAAGFANVIKSTNSGESWTQVNSGIPSINLWSLAIDSNVSGTVYVGTDGGVYKTTNGGGSWVTGRTKLPESLW